MAEPWTKNLGVEFSETSKGDGVAILGQAAYEALLADRDRLAREHAFQKDALDAMTAARDRLARECNVHALNCAHLRAELSAARALLREARGGCVGTDSPWLGSDQQEAWCYLVDALIGAASSAGGPQS